MDALDELRGLLRIPKGTTIGAAWDRNLFWRNRAVEKEFSSPDMDLCDALADAWSAIAGLLEAEASGRAV